jgi:hypothetical protein
MPRSEPVYAKTPENPPHCRVPLSILIAELEDFLTLQIYFNGGIVYAKTPENPPHCRVSLSILLAGLEAFLTLQIYFNGGIVCLQDMYCRTDIVIFFNIP